MEQINLNLVPSGVNPVCHVSQYDTGRQIKLNLLNGTTAYSIQSGDSVTLEVRKPDNTIVTAAVTATEGANFVTIETTEQMCAVSGVNLCQLSIENGSDKIGTLNFLMAVEQDVLANGDPSQSEIHDLPEQIDDYIESSVWGFKVLSGTLTAGSTSLTLSDAAITSDSALDVYTEIYGVGPTDMVATTGSVTMTFEARSADLGVKVRVYPNE